MFNSEVYQNRRRALLEKMAAMTSEGSRGLAVFLGNVDAPANYRGNDYKFRQDSNFLYFWEWMSRGLLLSSTLTVPTNVFMETMLI